MDLAIDSMSLVMEYHKVYELEHLSPPHVMRGDFDTSTATPPSGFVTSREYYIAEYLRYVFANQIEHIRIKI